MNTYEEIADHAGLDTSTKLRYVKYMRLRWAVEEPLQCQTGYAMEWAQRFLHCVEYESSDPHGQAILDSFKVMK